MTWMWVVATTALISFCLVLIFRLVYKRGYRDGAEMVLEEWRESVQNYIE